MSNGWDEYAFEAAASESTGVSRVSYKRLPWIQPSKTSVNKDVDKKAKELHIRKGSPEYHSLRLEMHQDAFVKQKEYIKQHKDEYLIFTSKEQVDYYLELMPSRSFMVQLECQWLIHKRTHKGQYGDKAQPCFRCFENFQTYLSVCKSEGLTSNGVDWPVCEYLDPDFPDQTTKIFYLDLECSLPMKEGNALELPDVKVIDEIADTAEEVIKSVFKEIWPDSPDLQVMFLDNTRAASRLSKLKDKELKPEEVSKVKNCHVVEHKTYDGREYNEHVGIKFSLRPLILNVGESFGINYQQFVAKKVGDRLHTVMKTKYPKAPQLWNMVDRDAYHEEGQAIRFGIKWGDPNSTPYRIIHPERFEGLSFEDQLIVKRGVGKFKDPFMVSKVEDSRLGVASSKNDTSTLMKRDFKEIQLHPSRRTGTTLCSVKIVGDFLNKLTALLHKSNNYFEPFRNAYGSNLLKIASAYKKWDIVPFMANERRVTIHVVTIGHDSGGYCVYQKKFHGRKGTYINILCSPSDVTLQAGCSNPSCYASNEKRGGITVGKIPRSSFSDIVHVADFNFLIGDDEPTLHVVKRQKK